MKIKPCPFCGSEEPILRIVTDYEDHNCEYCDSWGYVAVCCDYTKLGCGATSGYAKTETEAVELWNKRNNKNECKCRTKKIHGQINEGRFC